MKPYPEYKDSGFEWLDTIPIWWDLRKIKTLASLITVKAESQTFPLALEHVQGWTGVLNESVPEQELSGEGIAFKRGDVLFGKLRPYLAKVWVSVRAGEAVGDFLVMRPQPDTDPNFLGYLMLTPAFISLVNGSTFGAKMPRASWAFIGNTTWALPPLREQKVIVDFLDRETAEIDAFIADQEKLIALLAERRTATITHAVTKGLNPDVQTKDSGVAWLAHVPLHWQVAPLRRGISYLTSGSRDWAALYADSGTPFVRIGNLTRGHLHLNMRDTQFVNVREGTEGQRSSLKVNDVLFSITAYLGSVAVVDNEMEGSFISQHIALVRPIQKTLSARFLGYCVLSDWGQRQLSEQGYGGTKIQLSLSDIKRFVSTLPPRPEQEEIASYLDSEAEKIDAAIADAQEAIALSKERRAALISAAVTGKIDVRGQGAPANMGEDVSVGIA